MNVLSLFDGMSCGRIALDRAGINVTKYYASEIDRFAIKVSAANYPDIIRLGDINNWREWDIDWSKIDLILAGSPCQGFSSAGAMMGFDDPRSRLFFVFVDILDHVRTLNPDVRFLLENVRMKQEWRDTISAILGVDPVRINSALVSAQNRVRDYWANWDFGQPDDLGVALFDIIQETVDEEYYIKDGRLMWLKQFGEIKDQKGYVSFNPPKAKCLTARGEPSWNTTYILQRPRGFNSGGYRSADGKTPALSTSSWEFNNYLLHSGLVRKLTPIECERLQTVPDNYTAHVSDSQRYKMLGNGWTVDVIAHILRSMD